jgi:putative CocE/NonD family hydrolase
MWGISWGGFNAIQVAMREPRPLKAIVAVDASDDLFRLDIHYIDGIMHLDEYELGIDLWNAVTPAPDFPTGEDMLSQRFDAEPWLLSWFRHQRDGPFWRRGSLAPDFDRLQLPALLVGGWLDGYRDSIARMLEHVPAPTRAIIGPWNHAWPHDAIPGPEIEWRAEAVRWWDHWLKGEDRGVLEEPRLAVFLRSWHPPDPSLRVVPGTWRWEDWPLEGAEARVLHLGAHGTLGRETSREGVHKLPYRPGAGVEAGAWWGELAVDQAALDETCLVYDSQPLDEDVAIIGFPLAVLHTSVDAPLAHWFVRLSDVDPRGRITLVTGGGLNGAHRGSTEQPEPLTPGVAERLEVPMRLTSWVFSAGHRIRLAVSNHLWPMMWPTPHRMTMSLHIGESHLVLPVVPVQPRATPRFDPPGEGVRPEGLSARDEIHPAPWEVERLDGTSIAFWRGEDKRRFPWGRMKSVEYLRFKVSDDRPDRAAALGEGDIDVTLPGRTLTWRTRLSLRSDQERFHYRFRRILAENGQVTRERSWSESIPRDHQ